MNNLGLNIASGKNIAAFEHIKMCVADILTTRVGTRIMRRHYGSYVPALIDSAMNDAGRLRLQSAIATALVLFEPRLQLNSVIIEIDKSGKVYAEINAKYNELAHNFIIAL